MSEPSDFVARLRGEQQAPGREEALRLDRLARRRRVLLAVGAAVLGLAVVGGWIVSSTGERPDEEPYAPQALDEAMWPPQWPATVRMPFRGSPSAAWADGVAGIDLPASEAVGALTSEQVGDVLRKTRGLLVESNLTPRVVSGGQPDAEVEKVLAQPGDGNGPLRFFTRFDPDEVMLHGTVIKTRGSMTYEASPADELVVHTDYTFVYPLVKVSGGTEVVPGVEEVTRVVVRRRLDLVASADGRLAVREAQWRAANDDCRVPEDGYLHPLFSKERAKAPKWPTLDPYDTGVQLAGKGSSSRECATPKQT
ncbi:hypothetical protein OV450_2961 [Actinobacteria bacterium OV450]|nr:hypothetical protein OV450_2961 [Actinobacteria bacterium OV450]